MNFIDFFAEIFTISLRMKLPWAEVEKDTLVEQAVRI